MSQDLVGFCNWIGYEDNTAYIFLLRDTLLPYIFYKTKGREHVYPWLIGRKFMEHMANEEGLDDEIRNPIFNAVDSDVHGFPAFIQFYKPYVMDTLSERPEENYYRAP